jgi:uncharacterized protein (TIGR00730 family)
MRVCVFCASSIGNHPRFADAARVAGGAIARRGVGIVYGGAQVGMMGVVADTALAIGGEVIGVLPRGMEDREVAHPNLTELHITDGMHARKQMMYALSNAFLALPGGYGTLDELFETLTWAQLGDHEKPIGLYNVAGYYDRLLEFLDVQAAAGLLRPEYRGLLQVDDELERLLDRLGVGR